MMENSIGSLQSTLVEQPIRCDLNTALDQDRIILPKSNLMLLVASEVSEICRPLIKYGIDFFSHTRVYPDGKFIDISNSAEMLEYFYYKTDVYKYYEPDIHPEKFDDGFFLCSTIKDNRAIQACREDLNIDNIIVLADKVENHYEVWNFGTKRGNDKIINFYLNNLDILRYFTTHFKEKGSKLIKKFEKNKIVRPVSLGNIKDMDLERGNGQSDWINDDLYHSKKYYLGKKFGDAYITSTEFKVLCWSVLGKSAEEIAIIIGSKKRTIEHHIENLKSKFACTNKLSLVRHALENTYLKRLIRLFIDCEAKKTQDVFNNF